MNEFSIESTKKIIISGFQGYKTLKEAQADGKIDFQDLPKFLAYLMSVYPALNEVKNIPSEFADLSEAEGNELIALVTSELGSVVDSADLVNKMNLVLKAAHAIKLAVQAF